MCTSRFNIIEHSDRLEPARSDCSPPFSSLSVGRGVMSYVTSESLREELRRFNEETFSPELAEWGLKLQQIFREDLRQLLEDFASRERDSGKSPDMLMPGALSAAGAEASRAGILGPRPLSGNRPRPLPWHRSRDAMAAAGSDTAAQQALLLPASQVNEGLGSSSRASSLQPVKPLRSFVAGREIEMLESERGPYPPPSPEPPEAAQKAAPPPTQPPQLPTHGRQRSTEDLLAARMRDRSTSQGNKAKRPQSSSAALETPVMCVENTAEGLPRSASLPQSPSGDSRPPANNTHAKSDPQVLEVVPGQPDRQDETSETRSNLDVVCSSEVLASENLLYGGIRSNATTVRSTADKIVISSDVLAGSRSMESSKTETTAMTSREESIIPPVMHFMSTADKDGARHQEMRRGRTVKQSEWITNIVDDCQPWYLRARRKSVKDWCESPEFEYSIVMLVLLNAFTIGVQTDYTARKVIEETPLVFNIIDKVFCVLFTAELSMRLYAFRCGFFWSKDWKWNLFDFSVVCLQLMEEILGIIALTAESAGGQRFSFMRVMRILRLIRIVRLVRVLRLINELRTIVDSIAGSMRSLCWTLVLLLLIIYIIGVYVTQLVTDHRAENKDKVIPKDDQSDEDALEHFFSSLIRAILSLYQAMTGGVDWDTLIVPLIDKISPMVGIIFVFYIAFAVLAFMNVITGVFVEAALKSAKDQQDVYIVHHARELFQNCDPSNSGKLSWDVFHDQISNPEMQMYFRLIDVDPKEAEGLFKLLDLDESGEVDYEEFLNGCLRLRGTAKAIDMVTVMIESRRLGKKWARHARTVEEDLLNVQDMLQYIEGDLSVLQQSQREERQSRHRESRVSSRPRSSGLSRSPSVREPLRPSARQRSSHTGDMADVEGALSPMRKWSSTRSRPSGTPTLKFTEAITFQPEEMLKDEWPSDIF